MCLMTHFTHSSIVFNVFRTSFTFLGQQLCEKEAIRRIFHIHDGNIEALWGIYFFRSTAADGDEKLRQKISPPFGCCVSL